MKKLSFVIPCYGSELTIESVIDEINSIMNQRSEFYSYEIICINDYSPDDVLNVLKVLSVKQSNLTIVSLARNSGKHAAVMAGYSLVNGDYIVNLDDDGQCPVDKLWEMIYELERGFDIVTAKYTKKQQSAFKNFGSIINDYMARLMIGKPKGVRFENFSIIQRFIVDEILKYKNPYPYLEGLLFRTTNNITSVKMNERERFAGVGGFTLRKSLSLWLNGFTSFSIKPLRVATVVGSLMAMLGFIFAIFIIIRNILYGSAIIGWASTAIMILFFNGITLMLLGLVGEYIGRIYISINNSPQYVIREVIKSFDRYEDSDLL